MSLSAYFDALRRAYQAELDDLCTDSEGRDVLKRRLAEKRSQMAFLSQMMEISPEMVAVAFHGGFSFRHPSVMEQILGLEPEDFPDWDALRDAIVLAPWAQALAAPLLQEPAGERFMITAAALEYLQQHPHRSAGATPDDSAQDPGDAMGRGAAPDADERADNDEPADDADLEQASDDWLEGQGFDRREA